MPTAAVTAAAAEAAAEAALLCSVSYCSEPPVLLILSKPMHAQQPAHLQVH
jgi:hypothetical protein